MERGADSSTLRPNGRPATQLFVKQNGRKPLFASANTSKDGSSTLKNESSDRARPDLLRYRPPLAGDGSALSRRTDSGSSVAHHREGSMSSVPSPGASRIPKPSPSSFSHRKPLSLAEALKMAEDEERRQGDDEDGHQTMDASPSPAPRSWRTRRDADQNKLRQQLGEDPLDAKARRKLPLGKSGTGNEGEPSAENNGPQNTESKAVETGRGLSKVIGNERPSWKERPDWRNRPKSGPEWFMELGLSKEGVNSGTTIPDLVPGVEDMALPSIEGVGQQEAHRFPRRRNSTDPENASPEKSFAWQVDEDFTAGDLQVSNSPRIKVDSRPFANRLPFDENSEVDINSRTRVNNPGSRNTKLDEIRSREVKAGNNIPLERPRSRTRNTKLDDIRARESEVEERIPIPDRHLTASRNTKLNDIRQREAEGLTRRQLASTRLEEIREQNAMTRSKSPEESRQTPSPRVARDARKPTTVGPEGRKESRPESRWDTGGERIPDTPVTIFKSRRAQSGGVDGDAAVARDGQNGEREATRPGLSHGRADSRNLLRQLARAASSSPAPESQTEDAPATNRRAERNVTDSSAPTTRGPRRALTTSSIAGARRTNNNRDAGTSGRGNSRPTVEFAGLRKVRSTESTGSKRSSVHSEMDPTDRIEAEAKLFAPLDNHSEKGSVRAPSPASGLKKSEDEETEIDATPKPRRNDPLSMPTPKVVGAYVETPATVKFERFDPPGIDDAVLKRRPRDLDTISEPGEDEKPSAITISTAARRPRSQSLPRPRPPLKNTAKLPSVKDDLLELQQMYNIDDTTLDNLEEVISGRKPASPRIEALLQDLPAVSTDDDSFDLELDHMKEQSELDNLRPIKTEPKATSGKEAGPVDEDLAAYLRMSKTLRTGLLGIRSAKQGIERLEDNLAHSQHPPPKTKMDTETPAHTHTHQHDEKFSACAAPPNQGVVAYVHLPIPRLYSLQPRFRLTIFGFLTLALCLWYSLETAMCKLYCAPETCTSTPCVWSYDDPTFGTALPVKLDQWTTGGVGRTLFNEALEEAEDWVADMLDMAYGREITDIDVERLSFEGKRAHRRRLRKKGLDKRGRQAEQEATPEVRARWNAWHQERLAREKARDARAMGYAPVDEDYESIGGDQRIW